MNLLVMSSTSTGSVADTSTTCAGTELMKIRPCWPTAVSAPEMVGQPMGPICLQHTPVLALRILCGRADEKGGWPCCPHALALPLQPPVHGRDGSNTAPAKQRRFKSRTGCCYTGGCQTAAFCSGGASLAVLSPFLHQSPERALHIVHQTM